VDEPNKTRGLLLKEYYFPTQIFFKDLADHEPINASLVDYIYRCRAQDEAGIVRSNVKEVNAWHSALDMHHHQPFRPLVKAVMDTLGEVFENLDYHPDYEPVCNTMWANVSPRYGFNRGHTHPGSLWSGVYYVQAPEGSGKIYFNDPRAQAHVILPRYRRDRARQAESWSEVYFAPTTGRLIVFPAWLLHEVQPNLATAEGPAGDRISISFNIHQEIKPGAIAESEPGHDTGGNVPRSQLE
jgi:uncharacterized protein (TIGR02466 family)